MSTITSPSDRKRHGQHYTPASLADFLAEQGVRSLNVGLTAISVLDPACGDGELLFAAHRAIEGSFPDASVRLVGYDIDEEAVKATALRAAELGIAIELSPSDFLTRADEHSREFDLVITNPPYVRTQQLGGELAQTLSERFGLSGRIDLTHPFVSVAPIVLRDAGVLALLCSNRFLTTKAGSNMRRVLSRQLQPLELYDLGDSKLFEAAVLPAIVIAAKRPGAAPCKFVSSYQGDSSELAPIGFFDALRGNEDSTASLDGKCFTVRVGTLDAVDLEAPWRMGGRHDDSWLEGIRQGTWKSFGDVAKIRVGIKTTADAVFLGSEWNLLPEAMRPESDILLPLTTHRNARTWRNEPGDFAVLYPYDLNADRRVTLDMQKYPRAMAYLKQHRARLSSRTYVIDSGREWFEIWVAQKPAMWAIPKIVFPDISEEPRFSWDQSGAVVNGDCYWMSLDDIGDERVAMLMLGVANSSLAVRFYDVVCGNKLYAGKRRWISQYVSRLPVPDPNSAAAAEVVAIVRAFVEQPTDVSVEDAGRLDDAVERAFRASTTA